MARRKRRWLRAILYTLLGLVTLPVLLVLFVLYTPWGTRLAVTQGLAFYDDGIPATIELGSVRGILGGTVTLESLRFFSSNAQPLVEIDHAELELAPLAALGLTLAIDALDVEGLRLHLWPDPDAWASFSSPKPDPTPPDPNAPPGPDLPLEIRGELSISAFTVWKHGEEASESTTLARDLTLQAHVWAKGTSAELLLLNGAGWAGPSDLPIVGLRSTVGWNAPHLEVAHLEALTPMAWLEGLEAELDTEAKTWNAKIHASATTPSKSPQPALVARTEIVGSGSFEQAYAGIDVNAPGLVSARLDAVARFAEDVDVALSGVGELEAAMLPGVLAPLDRTPFALLGGASLDEVIRARLVLLAPELVVAAHVEPHDGAGETPLRAHAAVYVPGMDVVVDARLADWAPHEIAAAVDIASLARLQQALPQWVNLPPSVPPDLGGALALRANCLLADPSNPRCVVSLEAKALRASGQEIDDVWVNVQGTLQDLEARLEVRRESDFLKVAARVEREGKTTLVALQDLQSRIQRQTVTLRSPAEITISPDSIDVRDLDIDAARGRITASGHVAWEGRSNAAVDVHALDLSLIRQYVPAVDIEGRLDGHIEIEGEASDPHVGVGLNVRDLAYEGQQLGAFEVAAKADRAWAEVDIRWRERDERLRVSARVPVVVDLTEKRFALRERQSGLRADVDLLKFDLRHLDPWIAQDLDGRVELHLVADGSVREPRVRSSGALTGLELGDWEIGDASLQARWDEGRAEAQVQLSGPSVKTLDVSASVPLPLDATQTHDVSVLVEALDLAAIRNVAPDLDLEGLVGGTVRAHREDGALVAEVDLLGRELAFRQEDMGSVQVRARWADGRASARVTASGSRVRLLDVEAEVPLVLTEPYGGLNVPKDAPLKGSLALKDADLAAISRWTGQIGLGGRLDGRAALTGTFARPAFELVLDGQRLAVNGHPLGDVDLEAAYRDERASAQVRQRKGRTSITAAVDIPVAIDPSEGAFAWHKDELHRVNVVARAIDRDVLAAVAEVPREWDPRISADVELVGRAGDMRGRGSVRAVFAVPEARDTSIAVMFDLQETEQRARVVFGALGPASLSLDARTDIVLASLFDGTFAPKNVLLDARAHAQGFPLREFGPLMPMIVREPEGTLSLRASAKGPLVGPKVLGTLAIDKGEMTVVALNQRLKEIDMHATFDGPEIDLESLSFRSGDGRADIEGRAHLARGGTWAEVKMRTKEFPVVRPGLPLLRIDGDIDARVDGRGETTDVAIHLRSIFVDILDQKLLGNPEKIPAMDGVEMVDRSGLKATEEEDASKKEPWLPADMKLTADLSNPALIRGSQTEMMWGGRVEVTRSGEGGARVEGGFKAQSGYFELLNHEFDLAEGSVLLPEEGDIDPYIDVTAETTIAEYLVTVRISGRAKQPLLKMTSNPPLPEEQVFALIITGRPDAGAGEGTDVATKAATLLANFQNPALQQQLRDQLGIDRVGLGFGDSIDEPMLTVGKRINRKLYVETTYHVNADLKTENRAEARMEYRFKPPAWSLETLFGTEGIGRIGLWWQRSFGGPHMDKERRPSSTAAKSR